MDMSDGFILHVAVHPAWILKELCPKAPSVRAQPTFVAMYAELCSRLGTELPELAPPEGETQPMSFQRLLLNTCQEEFEGTADARAVRLAFYSIALRNLGPKP